MAQQIILNIWKFRDLRRFRKHSYAVVNAVAERINNLIFKNYPF